MKGAHIAGISTIYLPVKNGESCGTGENKEIPVDIFVPSSGGSRGEILVLPGWNYSRKRWYNETLIVEFAQKYSFGLIFPEMSVSSYESEYFPETSMKWSDMPGGEWIRSVLIPVISEKYGLLKSGGKNFVLGLSTGARGSLLVPLQNPGLFSGAAALSGDCDQSLMKDEEIYISLYGEYDKFCERWKNVDNPLKEIRDGKWNLPIYIGHGMKDTVSPFSQSELLFSILKKRYPGLKIVFNAPDDASHDFLYWGSEIPHVMAFFNEIASV